jgi:hypothetical protein
VVAAIKGRPAQETLDSLRLTLLKVEQSVEPDKDTEAMAELKRILLHRIAELEAIQALESAGAQTADKPDPADLVAPVIRDGGRFEEHNRRRRSFNSAC